jgi:hypothetical protein
MPDPIKVEREGGVTLLADDDGIVVQGSEAGYGGARIEPADLHWLVTTGGPAMIALLGGPIEGRGIERTGGGALRGKA